MRCWPRIASGRRLCKDVNQKLECARSWVRDGASQLVAIVKWDEKKVEAYSGQADQQSNYKASHVIPLEGNDRQLSRVSRQATVISWSVGLDHAHWLAQPFSAFSRRRADPRVDDSASCFAGCDISAIPSEPCPSRPFSIVCVVYMRAPNIYQAPGCLNRL